MLAIDRDYGNRCRYLKSLSSQNASVTSEGFLSFLFTLILGVQSEDLQRAPSGGGMERRRRSGEMEISTDSVHLHVWPHRLQITKVILYNE